MKYLNPVILILAMVISCDSDERQGRIDSAKRVSLVKQVYFELFAGNRTFLVNENIDVNKIRCLEHYPDHIRADFVSGVSNGKVLIGRIEGRREVIIWRTSDVEISCDKNGIVSTQSLKRATESNDISTSLPQ